MDERLLAYKRLLDNLEKRRIELMKLKAPIDKELIANFKKIEKIKENIGAIMLKSKKNKLAFAFGRKICDERI
jgi:hypothetical protein